MIVRCQLCNTPLFELTKRGDECIIIVKGKHHGEWHKSRIRIEDLIAKLEEPPETQAVKRYISHNLTDDGNEAAQEIFKVRIVSNDEINVVLASGEEITVAGCGVSPALIDEMLEIFPDAEDLREESPDDPRA